MPSLKARLEKYLNSNKSAKSFMHWLMFPKDDYRPRWWMRVFVNPFVHTRKGRIRWSARLDLVPNHDFVQDSKSIIESYSLVNNVMGPVYIGKHALIGKGSVVIGPATIENDVLLAQNVIISALNHNYEDITKPIREQHVNTQQVNIGAGTWIGSNAVVLPGITIGKNCVIGAGSIVTKDIPDYCVVVGSPAKIVRRYNETSGNYEKWIAKERKSISVL